MKFRFLFVLALGVIFSSSFQAFGAALLPAGHTLLPAVTQPFAAVTVVSGSPATTLNLASTFDIDGVTNQVVQFNTNGGPFNIELQPSYAPKTVANFLGYVTPGAYNNSLIHRVVAGFVIQGGGYTVTNGQIATIPTNAAVVNEFNLSNVTGTVAMAKLGTDPNSATDQWFINLADNSSNLDNANSGYTVFARVIGSGMTLVQQIGALMTVDESSSLGAPFNQLPVINYTSGAALMAANLVVVTSASVVPIYPTAGAATSVLTFSITSNSNPSLVTPTISGSSLVLNYAANQTGAAAIVVRATDTDGNKIESTLNVTVGASSPIVSGGGSSPANYQNILFSGNTYDVVLLNSPSVTVAVKPGHITRVSFIDPNNNICFMECGGSGSFTVSIPNPVIAAPVNYNQPTINYAKGVAAVSVSGNDATTYVSVFSLGTDPTRVDPRIILNPGSITGIANTQSFSVTGAAMGGINLANDQMSGSSGVVGVSAPILTTTKFIYLGNLNASGTATPQLQFAPSAAIPVAVAGGTMQQTNAKPIQCTGVASVTFSTGTTATAATLPEQTNQGQYVQNGVNVTSTLVKQ